MLDSILQSFLRDAIQRLFGGLWEVRLFAHFQVDLQPMTGAYGRRLLLECTHQTLAFQRLWPELEDQRSELRKSSIRQVQHILQQPARALGCSLEELVGRRRIQCDAIQRL
jgi:hypothetical protein